MTVLQLTSIQMSSHCYSYIPLITDFNSTVSCLSSWCPLLAEP